MKMPLRVAYPCTGVSLAAAAKDEPVGRVRQRILTLRLLRLGKTIPEVAPMLSISPTRLRQWVHRFNREGLAGLQDRPRPGRPKSLTSELERAFRRRVLDGPQAPDHVCTLRGRDIQGILTREFHASYSLSGTYFLLHRLKLSSLVPRPRSAHSDPMAQEAFKKKRCRRGSRPRAGSIPPDV